MSKNQVTEDEAAARAKADRLRALKLKVGSIGKRGLEDTFTLGEALEEASVILRGSFSTWVKSECGIEPRTALGFRKTFRVLGDRKDWLVKHEVAPSVAVMIACGDPEGRDRALDAIGSGRRLTANGAKLVLKVEKESGRKQSQPIGFASLKATARAFCETLFAGVEQLASLAAKHDSSDVATLAELVIRARALTSGMAALDLRPLGEGKGEPHPIAVAVANLAKAEAPDAVSVAASALARAVDGTTTTAATDDAPSNAVSSPVEAPSGIRTTHSVHRHGLTAFEICAGGGGQAAGLARAGFKHVGMLEREAKPCDTLRAAFGPEHVIEADVVGYEPGDIGPIDLFAGGVPCTPFSMAGEQKGEFDAADCFPEALRLVKLMKPRAVMLENVTGIMGPKHDLYRASILSKLSGMGYQSEWRVVRCTHFGLAQNRKRAILVAFKDPAAMARFKWPSPVAHYADEPYPMIAALDSFLRARGYEPPEDLQERMNRTSPTVIGGSPNKASPDMGQANVREVWEGIGVVGTRWGDHSPGHDHVGLILPTNRMIAALQGFPESWPFKGGKRDVYRQIANAFPPVVAMHLGCAIASALTGTEYLPETLRGYSGLRNIVKARAVARRTDENSVQPSAEGVPSGDRKTIPLALLRQTSSINEPESTEGDVHDIDYSALLEKFGPWPVDMWAHQRTHGRL